MKVWENWKSLGEAMPNLRRRNCWQKCNDCNKAWKETLTKMVHMIVVPDESQKSLTRFICDDCLKSKKENI